MKTSNPFYVSAHRSYTSHEYMKAVDGLVKYENGRGTFPCIHDHDDCALAWNGPCSLDAKTESENNPGEHIPSFEELRKSRT